MILTVTPLRVERGEVGGGRAELGRQRHREQRGVRRALELVGRPAVQGRVGVVRVEPAQHVEQAQEDGDLQEHREAAHERVGLLDLVQLHHFFLERLPVTLVLLLQLLDLGLQCLHRPLGLDLLDEDGEEDDAQRHHQEDDREDPGPVGAQHPAVGDADRVPEGVPAQEDPRNGEVDPVETQFMLQSHQQDGDGSGQAPGRTRQGGRGGTATAARSPGRSRGERRASRAPPGRTRCTRGRTDSGPATPGSYTDGTRRSARVSSRATAGVIAAAGVTEPRPAPRPGRCRASRRTQRPRRATPARPARRPSGSVAEPGRTR